ncbi:MAG TPA: B12-binding domain-containing protein [Acidimicrobiales bacterium]|nr:B12-binding domain-containing protein [Acidimicrobiales bacterium]
MDLQESADALGVHYQTAYRWVREGTLPAVKIGSTYEIEESAVLALKAARETPVPPPRQATVRSWPATVQRLVAALETGDELAARALVDRLAVGGMDAVRLVSNLLAPAMRTVGDHWAQGRASVGCEHRATGVCERILARLSPHPRGRPRGVAVVAMPSGDTHGLAAAMAAAALRADRWRVHHLGSDLPPDELAAMAADVSADLVVVSVCYATAADTREAVEAGRKGAPRVLVGEPGADVAELVAAARSSAPTPWDADHR